MQILKDIPSSLLARAHSRHVAILCDCGVTMLWEKASGNGVVCPSCRLMATLDIDGTLPPETEVVDGVEQVKGATDGTAV